MKKTLVLALTSILVTVASWAQAPVDLSFLTNRAALASWALKQVDTVNVRFSSSGTGTPSEWVGTNKTFAYTGKPSLTAVARSLKGVEFDLSATIPDSIAFIDVDLLGTLPDGSLQYLFYGGTSGKPEYNGTRWVLPKDASSPPIRLEGSIFIPVKGITKAWVVETNQWGYAYKKSLNVWTGQGFIFETSLAGEVFLCMETEDVAGSGQFSQWVYDLRSTGQRGRMTTIVAYVSLKDSEDVRDFGDNAGELYHWTYTYKPDNSALTYGKVPLLVANYTTNTTVRLCVDSSVGYARSFVVTRIADAPGLPETRSVVNVSGGAKFVDVALRPGLYHIVPLGISVCPDWWKILDVDGWEGGKG